MAVVDPQILWSWLRTTTCAVGALWAAWRCVACIRRDRVLADTPLVHIRSAAQGYVKVRGRAQSASDPPTAAPLSNRPCVWWSFDIEQRCRTSRNRSEWRSLESATSVELFELADADGRCLVGPVNAEITPTHTDVWYGDKPRPGCLPRERGPFLSESEYRYTERLLCVGDQLSVAGELRSKSEIPSTEVAELAILHAWKQDQRALLARFDQDHDGRLDATEWEAARQAAVAAARGGALATPVVRSSVIGEPTHGEPFVIASLDSAQLVRREKLHAALYLALGIACSLLCAWGLEHAAAMR